MADNNKYYQSKHFIRLLIHYEQARMEGQVPYMEADELTDIAEYYMTKKQDEEANCAIRAAIKMHPDSVDPQIFLARQKMFYGKLDEARSIIDAITEQDDPEVIYIRAELLIKEGHPNKASSFLINEMHKMQDNLENYIYDCTSIFMDYDQWEQAHRWLKFFRDTFPGHPSLPIMEAEILMGLDRYEDAMPQLKDILEKEPYNSEAWNLLAETYGALEMYAEAVEAADFSLAINPDDCNAHLMKANACMNSGQTAEAIGHYVKYLHQQDDDVSVQISLSLCYISEERFEEANSTLSQAEDNAAGQPDKQSELSQIYQLRAFAMSRMGNTEDAHYMLSKAWECCDRSQIWRCAMTEADICLQEGQLEKAEKCFTIALRKCPDRAETLFNIALSYSNAGYNDAAIDLLDDVWTIFGTEEGKFVVPYLANCYLRKNDMEKFLQYLKIAPSCDREATLLLFHDRFPGIIPEDYYAYAYKEVHGVFPTING